MRLMTYKVTLHLEETAYRRARAHAAQIGLQVEDVLAIWLEDYAENVPVESLSDDELIALCHYQLNPMHANELRHLLEQLRFSELSREQNKRLDDLLRLHRRGLVRKSRALHVAALRGLTVQSY